MIRLRHLEMTLHVSLAQQEVIQQAVSQSSLPSGQPCLCRLSCALGGWGRGYHQRSVLLRDTFRPFLPHVEFCLIGVQGLVVCSASWHVLQLAYYSQGAYM